MNIFKLVLGIYIVIVLVIIILYFTRKHRNYWVRMLMDLKPCPFGKQIYEEQVRYNDREADGYVSYTLFGDYNKYAPTLYKSLENISKYLPRWVGIVYVAIDIPKNVLKNLRKLNATVVVMGPNKPLGYEASLWRFLPAKGNKPFVSLDADDLFTSEIAGDISMWIDSDKPFCILNQHNFALPMTAGTWGSRWCSVPDMKERMDKYCEHWFGFDESFLYNEIWPIVRQKGYWLTNRARRYDLAIIIGVLILISFMIYSLYLLYNQPTP